MAEYAHAHGVPVEGEVGRIKGAGVEGVYSGDDFLARVEEAVRFVHGTDVDSLAVAIGTAHGFYQGKPEINFDRLHAGRDAAGAGGRAGGSEEMDPQLHGGRKRRITVPETAR